MSYLVGAFATAIIAALQVAVAPLFPIAGAQADLAMITILTVALLAGPRPAMVATPALAIAIGFAGSRSPGLLLVSYAAVLPLAAFMEGLPYSLGRFSRLLVTAVIAGAWGRFLLGVAAIAASSSFTITPLVFQVMLPGIVFDALLIGAVYLACQLSGAGLQRFTLQRAGWRP